jgi:uncharacterized protein YcsI (UPF0317 family)
VTTIPASEGWTLRQKIRNDGWASQTSGQAYGHVQGNVAILPADLADDFLRFCLRNPKPCPVLAVSDRGNPLLSTLGRDVDIRTDVPRYRIWEAGRLVGEPLDIRDLWRDDLVTFVLGCSFSFEQALAEAGIEMRHWTQGCNVPMFLTSQQTVAAGPFAGPLVVSMRPMTPANAVKAVQITSRFNAVHGAPVHIGKPEMLGIRDLQRPDFGEPVEIRDDELPVFWACGVTPQAVVMSARPPLCITHAPGHMLVTDLLNATLSVG